MIKPIISTNTQVQKTTSNISDSGSLTEQLKALNELLNRGISINDFILGFNSYLRDCILLISYR